MVYPGQIRYGVSYATGSLKSLGDIISYSGNFASYNEAKRLYNKTKKTTNNLLRISLGKYIYDDNLDLHLLEVLEESHVSQFLSTSQKN